MACDGGHMSPGPRRLRRCSETTCQHPYTAEQHCLHPSISLATGDCAQLTAFSRVTTYLLTFSCLHLHQNSSLKFCSVPFPSAPIPPGPSLVFIFPSPHLCFFFPSDSASCLSVSPSLPFSLLVCASLSPSCLCDVFLTWLFV